MICNTRNYYAVNVKCFIFTSLESTHYHCRNRYTHAGTCRDIYRDTHTYAVFRSCIWRITHIFMEHTYICIWSNLYVYPNRSMSRQIDICISTYISPHTGRQRQTFSTWQHPTSHPKYIPTHWWIKFNLTNLTFISPSLLPPHLNRGAGGARQQPMGWLRLVGSIKLQVSFAEYRLFYRALLQKRPVILSIQLTEATPHMYWDTYINRQANIDMSMHKHVERGAGSARQRLVCI